MLCMDGMRKTLAGRYELGEVIGRGGMGTVYRAKDLVLRRTVAVKVLPGALAESDATHVARFEREARAAASLNHPGVVAVYDSGADEATRFIVMECVSGQDLAAVLRDQAPLEPARAVSIAERVADALAAAHAAGIVHRDVKPANVMLAADGSVKVLDFGIARALDGATLTHGASVLGSAAYMAPEQALGERADERSDIYSLGCLLYAMLTGRPPFTGEAGAAVLHQHVNAEPRPPSEIDPRVSPALDALVIAMLAKAPDARPQSAAQLRGRLAAMPGELPTISTPANAPTAPTAPLEQTAVTRALASHVPANAGGARAKRHRLAAAALLGGCALLVAVIVALATGGGSRRPEPAARHNTTAAHGTPARTSPPTSAPGPSVPATTTPAATGAPGPPHARSAPATSPEQPGQSPGRAGEPPGHGGLPPGQAKKHDGSHGHSHGN
jgi:serine/threonine-protein kinase